VTSAEDGAGCLAFFRDLVARGLSGVSLVTSDAHRGLVEAIGATLPCAASQRCRTHPLRSEPDVSHRQKRVGLGQGFFALGLRPDTDAVQSPFDRILDALADKLSAVAQHLDAARADILAFTAAPTSSASSPSNAATLVSTSSPRAASSRSQTRTPQTRR
jgi:putative transposase